MPEGRRAEEIPETWLIFFGRRLFGAPDKPDISCTCTPAPLPPPPPSTPPPPPPSAPPPPACYEFGEPAPEAHFAAGSSTSLDTNAYPGGFNYSSLTIEKGANIVAVGANPLIIRVTHLVNISGMLNISGGRGGNAGGDHMAAGGGAGGGALKIIAMEIFIGATGAVHADGGNGGDAGGPGQAFFANAADGGDGSGGVGCAGGFNGGGGGASSSDGHAGMGPGASGYYWHWS